MDWQTVYQKLPALTTYDELVHTVLPDLGQLLPATQIELYLDDTNPSCLIQVGTWGLDQDTAAARAACARTRCGPVGWVMQHDRSLTTADGPPDATLPGARFPPHLLYVPLKCADRRLGALGIGRDETPFTAADLAAVQALAGQLALVLENIALRRGQDPRHLANLRAVYQVNLLLSSIRDPATLMTQMATIVRDAFTCAYVAVFQYDPSTNELVLVAFDGERKPPLGIRLPLGRGLAGHAAQQVRTVYAPDVQQDPRYYAGPLDPASEISIPLRRGERLLGVLNVASRHLHAYDVQAIQVLESLAHAASLALENAEMFADSGQRIRTQEILIRISQALNTASSLDATLDLVLEAGIALVGKRIGAILLLDERSDTLRIVASRGIRPEAVAAFNAHPSHTHEDSFASTIRTGQIVEVPDTTAGRYFLRDMTDTTVEQITKVPLHVGQRVIGILALDALPVDDQAREVLRALADMAAIAIEKSRLLEQARDQAHVANLLLEISTTLGSFTNLDDLLRVTIQAVQQVIDAAQCWLFLRQGERWLLQPDPHREPDAAEEHQDLAGPEHWPTIHPLTERLRQMLAQRESVVFETGDGLPPLDGPLSALSPGQMISLTPLLGTRDHIGFLVIARALADGTFTPPEMALITGIAQRATAAIENQQLIGRIQGQLRKSARLYEISTRLHAAYQLSPLLHNAVADISEVLGAQAVEIILFDAKGTRELRVATGLPDAVWEEATPRPSGSARTIWRTGQLFVLNDANLAPAMIHPRLRQAGISALLGLPLRGRNHLLGVVRVMFDRPQQFLRDDVDSLATYVNQVAVAIENARLYQSLESLQMETIRALIHAFEAKDYYSAQHSEEVMKYALALARELGLDETQCRNIQFGALLHDIGKIGIGDQILLKGAPLDTAEWQLMRMHPVIGAEIVKGIRPLQDVVAMIRHHHERFDGRGYPNGLAGEAIPLGARILSVIDAFESMISDRAYRKALSVAEALERLESGAGQQWDEHIVDAWCVLVRRERQKLLGVKWDQLVKEREKANLSRELDPSRTERASLAQLPDEDLDPIADVVLHSAQQQTSVLRRK